MSNDVIRPVIIVGGGVTGMAAAVHLAQAGQTVLLLEKEAALGGKAQHINCKQIEGKCTHCGACAVFELVHQVKQNHLIAEAVRQQVKTISNQGKLIEVTVESPEGNWVITGSAALIAAGLKPYPAEERHETGYGKLPRVITALELEQRARQMGSFSFLGRSPRIAMVHCVGSRQRYCSRVCCLYGAKISRLLSSFIPEAAIGVYCLDRQHYQQAYQAEWPKDINFTAAMPGRIYRNPEGDCVVRCEDILSGAVTEGNFDWVVLCTGLVPDPAAVALGRGAGLGLDQYGFLERYNQERVWAAGGATAPLSFFECIEHGISAAGEILSLLESEFPQDTRG